MRTLPLPCAAEFAFSEHDALGAEFRRGELYPPLIVHAYGKAKVFLAALDRVEQWTSFEESLFGGFARPCFMSGARDGQPIVIPLDHSVVIECANDYGHCGQYVRRISGVPYSQSPVLIPDWLSDSLSLCGPAALIPCAYYSSCSWHVRCVEAQH